MNSKSVLIVVFFLVIAAIGVVLYEQRPRTTVLEKYPVQERPQSITVHLEGAVKQTGVYNLSSNVRVYELLLQSGGILPLADLRKINLARTLKDGEKLVIPFQKMQKSINRKAVQRQSGKRVNINKASLEELMTLPGIGESYARRIMDYRRNQGGLNDIKQLLNVKGIGPKKLLKIKPYITL